MSTIEKKSLKVGKYVDNDHVDKVIRTYKQERWIQNSERLGKEDSLSSWYSVEELEEFIDTIKEHGANGIRIYFAAYPKDFAPEPQYAGRQTLVMVATKSKREAGKLYHKEVHTVENGKPQILAYNYGSLCPPFGCTPPPVTPSKAAPSKEAAAALGVMLIDRGEQGFSVV